MKIQYILLSSYILNYGNCNFLSSNNYLYWTFGKRSCLTQQFVIFCRWLLNSEHLISSSLHKTLILDRAAYFRQASYSRQRSPTIVGKQDLKIPRFVKLFISVLISSIYGCTEVLDMPWFEHLVTISSTF